MKFQKTEIPEVVVITPRLFKDSRGFFAETFRQDKLESFLGYNINFCQDNLSKSSFGVLRGLHYQMPPFSQTKLVSVLQGRVLDVAVDIRKGSPNFGKYVALELSADNHKQLLVPRGFAHGFVVLSDTAIFNYKVDNYYNAASERGVQYNTEALSIDWQLPPEQLILSEKDKQLPAFEAAELFSYNTNYYD